MFHDTSEHPEQGCGSNGKEHALSEAERSNHVRTEPAAPMIVEIPFFIYLYIYRAAVLEPRGSGGGGGAATLAGSFLFFFFLI